MTYRPDYEKAEKAAHLLLETNNVDKLPVKVKKLAKNFPDLRIKKYSWFADKWDIPIERVCELADSNEGCCWYTKATGEYLILYNDQVSNVGRIRWTLAHELGHYMLKHNELTNKAILSRSSLSDNEYNIYEKEANCFARELLTPPPVIRAINIANPQFISDAGEISWEAANNVYAFIQKGAQLGIRYPTNNSIIRLFSKFIYTTKYAKLCSNCNHSFSNANSLFCPVCGEKSLINNSIFIFRRNEKMKYTSITLDEDGRAVQCSRCQNEEVVGDYCKVCGTYLLNVCTGIDPNEYSEFQHQGTRWDTFQGGCGELLEGNARYCSKCGSTSSFYEEQLLNHYEHELHGSNGRATSNGVLEISDDSLPF